jgi:hypothetical protein
MKAIKRGGSIGWTNVMVASTSIMSCISITTFHLVTVNPLVNHLHDRKIESKQQIASTYCTKLLPQCEAHVIGWPFDLTRSTNEMRVLVSK